MHIFALTSSPLVHPQPSQSKLNPLLPARRVRNIRLAFRNEFIFNFGFIAFVFAKIFLLQALHIYLYFYYLRLLLRFVHNNTLAKKY